MIPIPTLSFCITCKNRFHQISQTLRKNLDDNRLHQEWIEFVLVDFGSTDGLRNWVPDNFKDDLLSGYLKYYYTEELPFWHASIAKNTAHGLATHEILVNLDCDNYTGYHGGQFVIRQFLQNRNIILHQFGGYLYDGTYGRIAVLKKYFDCIGGYDESFGPMGYQDTDMIERLKRTGLEYRYEGDIRFCRAILNTKEEGLAYTNISMDYETMVFLNRRKSAENINNGRLIANTDHYGISGTVYDHNGNRVKRETERRPVTCNDGKTGEKVHVLHELVLKIAQLSGFSSQPGLFSGKTGLSILLFQASRYFQLPELEQTAGALLDDVVEESGQITSLDFGNGLSGIAWGINYLMKSGFVENDAGFFDEIDSLLFEEDLFCKIDKQEYSLIGLYIEARLSGSAEAGLWTERARIYYSNMANLISSQEKLFIRPPEIMTPFLYCLCCWKERGVIKEVAKEVISAAQELLPSTTRESMKTMPLQYYLHWLAGQKTIIQYPNLALADINQLFFYKLLFPTCPLPSACLLERNFSRILSAAGLSDELKLLNHQNIGITSLIPGFAWSLLQYAQCQAVLEY
jgi:hypothetical protein